MKSEAWQHANTVTRCAMSSPSNVQMQRSEESSDKGRVIFNGLSIRTSLWFSPLYHSVIRSNKFSRSEKTDLIQHFPPKKLPDATDLNRRWKWHLLANNSWIFAIKSLLKSVSNIHSSYLNTSCCCNEWNRKPNGKSSVFLSLPGFMQHFRKLMLLLQHESQSKQ